MKKIYLVMSLVLLGVVFHSCTKDQGKIRDTSCDGVEVKYSTDIEPLIKNSGCSSSFSCHFVGSPPGDFTTYEGIKEKVDNGTLRKRVIDGDPSFMPPTGPLPDSLIKLLDCWMKAGAPNN